MGNATHTYLSRGARKIENKIYAVILGSTGGGAAAGEFAGRKIGFKPGVGAVLGMGIGLTIARPFVEKLMRRADETERLAAESGEISK